MMKLTKTRVTAIISAFLLIYVLYVNIATAHASAVDPVIVEMNISAMYDIKDYGPEFIYDYIAPDAGEDEMIAVLENIKQISDEVCAGIDDEYEKIRSLDNYVSNLIAYDHDAAHNDVSFDTICLKNVLERNRTTCAGFSNLFASLAQAQGLYCVNIRGSAPDSELGITRDNLADESTPINHEWTAVWYEAESRWVYVDCTWNSLSRYENGEFSMRPAVTTYFDPDMDIISLNHKADSVVYRNFFEVASEHFADKVTTAVSPTVTEAVTTTAATAVTENTADSQISSSIQMTVAENGNGDSKQTLQTKSETKKSDDKSIGEIIPVVFFVSGCLVFAGAVIYVNVMSNQRKNKNDDNNEPLE